MFANVKTVFVDLDDTIWWFTENSKLSLRHVFEIFGISDYCDYDTFDYIYHEKNKELWQLYHYGKISKDYLVTERFRYVFERVGYPADMLDEAASEINAEYLNYLSTQPVAVPGAREMLSYLSRKYDVNVLSNGFGGVQQRKLASSGLSKFIRKLVLSDDCGITKPLPGIFAYALEACGAVAESSIMIGDNYDADICGAKNVGWRTIFFNKNGDAGTFESADAVVRSLDEVLALL